jgi:hypothetical protein
MSFAMQVTPTTSNGALPVRLRRIQADYSHPTRMDTTAFLKGAESTHGAGPKGLP